MESKISTDQIKLAIIGGSGAIGKEIIRCSKQDPKVKEIAIIGRRALEEWKQEDYLPELKMLQVENLDDLSHLKDQLLGYDVFISCLGARVKNGHQEFIRVERDIPLSFAALGKECGVNYVSYLSGNLVDSKSWFKECKVKAETEIGIFNMNFPVSTMFRPGMLVNRDNDFRWVEYIFAKLPGPKIEASMLGYAMYQHAVEKALDLKQGKQASQEKISLTNKEIIEYANNLKNLKTSEIHHQ
eukprot:403351358